MSTGSAGLPAAAAARLRSAVTLLVLAVLLLLGVLWAWGAATEPFPKDASTSSAPCTDVSVVKGQRLVPDSITVNVLNAGTREGLAAETLDAFAAAGFGRGYQGNAPSDADVKRAQIWASDPDDPAVRLVRSYLGKRAVVTRTDVGRPGVSVVVGNRFVGLADGRKSLRSDRDTTVCSPDTATR